MNINEPIIISDEEENDLESELFFREILAKTLVCINKNRESAGESSRKRKINSTIIIPGDFTLLEFTHLAVTTYIEQINNRDGTCIQIPRPLRRKPVVNEYIQQEFKLTKIDSEQKLKHFESPPRTYQRRMAVVGPITSTKVPLNLTISSDINHPSTSGFKAPLPPSGAIERNNRQKKINFSFPGPSTFTNEPNCNSIAQNSNDFEINIPESPAWPEELLGEPPIPNFEYSDCTLGSANYFTKVPKGAEPFHK